MRSYRKFTVWKRAHELTLDVYKMTALFPREEQFGLTSQMRRAAVSVPANLAEGCGRTTDADFARFVQISSGSINELDYHFELARDLGYLPKAQCHDGISRCGEIRSMLAGLLKKLMADS
jgi:four helix bundle protein